MFSENVVRQQIDSVDKEEVRDSRSNFARILSKNKENQPQQQGKSERLLEVERKLAPESIFNQTLMLQNRRVISEEDVGISISLARKDGLFVRPEVVKTLNERLDVASDIFEYSTSKEYIIYRDRIVKQRSSNSAAPPVDKLNSFGLVNLAERRVVGVRQDPND